MAASRSDALVLLGLTGDLAHKMTFPGRISDAILGSGGSWHNPTSEKHPDNRLP
jgi:hypothetical protein